MQRMRNGIDANGLTSLQLEWGGTHDALLGMFLWLYVIPTYSLNRYKYILLLLVMNVYIWGKNVLLCEQLFVFYMHLCT